LIRLGAGIAHRVGESQPGGIGGEQREACFAPGFDRQNRFAIALPLRPNEDLAGQFFRPVNHRRNQPKQRQTKAHVEPGLTHGIVERWDSISPKAEDKREGSAWKMESVIKNG
jgi:hypothetical protein